MSDPLFNFMRSAGLTEYLQKGVAYPWGIKNGKSIQAMEHDVMVGPTVIQPPNSSYESDLSFGAGGSYWVTVT